MFFHFVGITVTVNLEILASVNRAVYMSTGGEDEFKCGSALMFIDDAFQVLLQQLCSLSRYIYGIGVLVLFPRFMQY